MGVGGFCAEKSLSDEEDSSELSAKRKPVHVELFIEFCSSLQPVDLWKVAQTRGAQDLPDIALLTRKLQEPGYRKLISSILSGDVHSIETMAVSFCEYQFSQHVYYTEVRVDPFDFVTDNISAMQVLNCLLRGFRQGSKRFEIVVNVILELRVIDHFQELFRIAKRMRKHGVVGFCVPAHAIYKDAIQEIQKQDFGITMPAYSVEEIEFALDHDIKRLGQAFACVYDEKLYSRILNLDNNIFIECCITLATHEGHEYPVRNHPILSFKDGVRFGFNSGKPLHCETTFQAERRLLQTQFFGYFNQFFLETSTIWSIEHAFLSAAGKKTAIQHLSRFLRVSNKIPVE